MCILTGVGAGVGTGVGAGVGACDKKAFVISSEESSE